MIGPLLPEPGGSRGGGEITARSSTGSCGSCAQAHRGVTRRNATGRGRPATNAWAAGPLTAPGTGSSLRRRFTSTAHRRNGRSASTRRSCGRTSMPLAPARRGLPNKAGDTWYARWRGHRPVTRRTEHKDPSRRRRTRPAAVGPAHPTPGRRQPPTPRPARRDPRQRARPRTARKRPDIADRGQGIRPRLHPPCATATRDPARHPERCDQVARRAAKGSTGGRPPAFDKATYRKRNVVERCFNRLKQWRDLATRYANRASLYRSSLVLIAAVIWLR